MHINNLVQQDIPIGQYVTYINNDEITTSEVTHIHENKIIFSAMGDALVKAKILKGNEVDYGKGYSDSTNYFVGGALLLYFITIILGAYLAATSPFLITETIVYFVLVKNAIDGGLLNYETVIALIVVFILQASRYWEGVNNMLKQVLQPLILICLIITLANYIPYEQSLFKPMLMFVFLLTLLLIDLKKDSRILGYTFLLIIIFIPITKSLLLNGTKNISDAYISSDVEWSGLTLVSKTGNHNVYSYSPLNHETLEDLYGRFNANRNFNSVLIHNLSCYNDLQTKLQFKMNSAIIPRDIKTDTLTLRVKRIDADTFSYEIVTNSCHIPRIHDLLLEVLKIQGIQKATLYDFNSSLGIFI
jgi:hypothetical protein